jgi:hypothetical protein
MVMEVPRDVFAKSILTQLPHKRRPATQPAEYSGRHGRQTTEVDFQVRDQRKPPAFWNSLDGSHHDIGTGQAQAHDIKLHVNAFPVTVKSTGLSPS